MSHSPLISASTLAKSLSSYLILDVRGSWNAPHHDCRPDYDAEHIPSARNADWTKDFLQQGAPRLGLASITQDPVEAAAAFARLGIRANDNVVVYDQGNHMFAGRLWWSMRVWGFQQVQVLDGGWKKWKELNLPTSTEPVVPPAEKKSDAYYFAPVWQPALRMSLDQLLLVDTLKDVTLLDNRGPAGFAGKADDPASGHIPGAQNVPWNDLTQDDGTFHSREHLQSYLDGKVPDWRTSNQIVASCGSGYAATVFLIALEQAGRKTPTPMFDGSTAEWTLDSSRPMEQS